MATTNKTYLDYAGLQKYDEKIKQWANSINQIGFKTALTDAEGNYLYLYKKPNAVLADTPDVTISLGGGDLSARLDALATAAGAVWNSSTEKYDIALDSSFASSAVTIVNAVNELKGQINTLNGSDVTTGSVAKSIKDAVEGLDVSEFAVATISGGIVKISGIKEEDGKVAAGTNKVTLAKVAGTGAAADVLYEATIGSTVVSNVDDALDALADASSEGAESKTVYITETPGGSESSYSKRYGIYQGATGTISSPVISEKLVDIDIPKDMVVESGSVVDIVFKASDSTLHEGTESGPDVTEAIKGSTTPTAADAGKYIKLVIANAESHTLYIKASDFVDVYTGGENTETKVNIDNSNEITVDLKAIDSSKVAYTSSVNVKVALETLNGNSSTAGSVDNKIATAIGQLDTPAPVAIATYTSGISTAPTVITLQGSIVEADGIVSAGSADNITLSTITDAEIDNLFS